MDLGFLIPPVVFFCCLLCNFGFTFFHLLSMKHKELENVDAKNRLISILALSYQVCNIVSTISISTSFFHFYSDFFLCLIVMLRALSLLFMLSSSTLVSGLTVWKLFFPKHHASMY